MDLCHFGHADLPQLQERDHQILHVLHMAKCISDHGNGLNPLSLQQRAETDLRAVR